jgi:hypothetical protein
MTKKSLPLKESYEMLKAVREAVQPNRGFHIQLKEFEEKLNK